MSRSTSMAICSVGLATSLLGCLISPDPNLWMSRRDHQVVAEARLDGVREAALDAARDAPQDAGRDGSVPREGLAGERACSPNGILSGCDPIAQTGCKEGSCYPAKGGFACVCPAGTSGSGSACNLTRECAPGHVCAGSSAPGVCRPICATAGPACSTGSCTALSLYPGFGYCQPSAPDAGP